MPRGFEEGIDKYKAHRLKKKKKVFYGFKQSFIA
jgi:hypothetical protein